MDVRLLDDRGQRFLGKAPGLQEGEKIAARPQLGDAQFNGAGPRLPVALAVTVTLSKPVTALLAISSAGQTTDLQIHQPLCGKAYHLTQESASALFPTSACRFIVSSVTEGLLWLSLATPTYPKIFDGHP